MRYSARGPRTGSSRSASRPWSASTRRGEPSAVPVLAPRLGAFHSARARVRLRAVEPGTGAVVWETEQEASALDLDPGLASAKAAAAAGALLGRRAGGEL